MSIFWDPRSRKPQVWVYSIFIGLPILVFIAIYHFGLLRADSMDAANSKKVEAFK